MSKTDWVDPSIWYQQLPTAHVAAMALIRDQAGKVLLVKPNYRPHWTLPGGMADPGESPNVTVAREIDEELGMTFSPGHLAVVDWVSPQGNRKRPLLAFIFDGGVVDNPDVDLQKSELDAWRFSSVSDMGDLMPQAGIDRVRSTMWAAKQQTTLFLVNGIDIRPTSHGDEASTQHDRAS